MLANAFGVLDILVFGLTICVSLAIGIVFAIYDKRKKRNTPDHYFLGNRNGQTIPVMVSFVVTFQSSILLIGYPAEGYTYGITILFSGVAFLMCILIVVVFVVPVFYPLKLTSVYEYFKLRYGNRHLLYLVLTFGVTYTLFYMGTVTYGTSVALEVVTGIPKWATILIYLVVTTVYTSIGGINAVVWADVFQFVIMYTGVVTIITKGTLGAGGMDQVLELAHDRFNAIDISADPRIRYTIWNASFGSITIWMILCFMQPAMQRMYSMPSIRSARSMYLMSIPVFSLGITICTIEGAVLFAYFTSKSCDIISADIVNVNGLVPFAVLEMFQNIPGLRGLFIASLSSAALSTLSSCLSGLAALTYIDVIKVRHPDISVERATQVSKLTVVLFGLVAMGISFLVSELPGSIVALFQTFMACLDGPTSAVFLLSIFSRRVTSKGLIMGVIIGSSFPMWINLGRIFSNIPRDPPLSTGPTDQCWKYYGNGTESDLYINTSEAAKMYSNSVASQNATNVKQQNMPSGIEDLYSISYMWLSFIGFALTIIFSLLLSLLTKESEVIDERCLFSFEKHFRGKSGCKNEAVEKSGEHDVSNNLFDKNEIIPLVDQQ